MHTSSFPNRGKSGEHSILYPDRIWRPAVRESHVQRKISPIDRSLHNCSLNATWRVFLIVALSFAFLIGMCLLLSSPRVPNIELKSFKVHSWNVTEGRDDLNMPTRKLWVTGELKLNFHNPSAIYRMQVHTYPLCLMIFERRIAYSKDKGFTQEAGSRKIADLKFEASNASLYGVSSKVGTQQKLFLSVEGRVVGKLFWLGKYLHALRGEAVIRCTAQGVIVSEKEVKLSSSSCNFLKPAKRHHHRFSLS